jgi:hypothetical protein
MLPSCKLCMRPSVQGSMWTAQELARFFARTRESGSARWGPWADRVPRFSAGAFQSFGAQQNTIEYMYRYTYPARTWDKSIRCKEMKVQHLDDQRMNEADFWTKSTCLLHGNRSQWTNAIRLDNGNRNDEEMRRPSTTRGQGLAKMIGSCLGVGFRGFGLTVAPAGAAKWPGSRWGYGCAPQT